MVWEAAEPAMILTVAWDLAGQSKHAARGRHERPLHFGHAELGPAARDDEIASEHELASAGERLWYQAPPRQES